MRLLFVDDDSGILEYVQAITEGIQEGVVAALAYHHQPITSAEGKFSALTAVHVAEVLADSVGESAAQLNEGYLKSMGMEGRLPTWEEACKKAADK